MTSTRCLFRSPLLLLIHFFFMEVSFGSDIFNGIAKLGVSGGNRRLQTTPEESCNQSKQLILEDAAQAVFEWECNCEEVANSVDGTMGTFHLTCTARCGEFCNIEEIVCLRPGFISGFDSNNVNYLFSQTFQYTRGRSEYVERRVLFDAQGAPLECRYRVDQDVCQQCDIISCPGTTGAPINLVCENLEVGASFDFCTDPTPAVKYGIFEFLNPADFTVCQTPTESSGGGSPPTTTTGETSSPATTTGETSGGDDESTPTDSSNPSDEESADVTSAGITEDKPTSAAAAHIFSAAFVAGMLIVHWG